LAERVRISKKKNNRKRTFERKKPVRSVPPDLWIRMALKVLLVYWILIMLFLIGVIANMPFFRHILCSDAIC